MTVQTVVLLLVLFACPVGIMLVRGGGHRLMSGGHGAGSVRSAATRASRASATRRR